MDGNTVFLIIIHLIVGSLLLYWIYGVIKYMILPNQRKIIGFFKDTFGCLIQIVFVIICLIIAVFVLSWLFKGCGYIDPDNVMFDYDRHL